MKLTTGQYNAADPKQWLIFSHPWQDRVHPELAGRVAYVGSVYKKKVPSTSGTRSDEEQIRAGKDALAEHPEYYMGTDGAVYKPRKKGVRNQDVDYKMVSAPGRSNHKFGLAIDSFDSWLSEIPSSELSKYGLRKVSYEKWHVELIEVVGMTIEEKLEEYYKYLSGGYYPMDIKTFQMITGLKPDGVAGPLTKKKAEEVLLVCQDIIQANTAPTAPSKPAYAHEVIGTTHVVRVDPVSLKSKLVKASGKVLVKTEKDFINCNLFNSNLSIIGWLISEGKVLNQRREIGVFWAKPKGTLIVYKDGTVSAGWKMDSEIVKELDKIWFCTQGFNLFPVNLKKEGFPADVGRETDRMAIGFDGKDIVIAYRPATDAARAAQTMTNLGCKMAISLDSGLSSNMVLDGKAVVTSDRVLPCIITF
jgi:hypothetical protein